VRELNEGTKCLKVKDLLRNWKVDFVCLQETKLDAMSRSTVRKLWGCSRGLVLFGFQWGFRRYLDDVG
jgi:hypothetical protein